MTLGEYIIALVSKFNLSDLWSRFADPTEQHTSSISIIFSWMKPSLYLQTLTPDLISWFAHVRLFQYRNMWSFLSGIRILTSTPDLAALARATIIESSGAR